MRMGFVIGELAGRVVQMLLFFLAWPGPQLCVTWAISRGPLLRLPGGRPGALSTAAEQDERFRYYQVRISTLTKDSIGGGPQKNAA